MVLIVIIELPIKYKIFFPMTVQQASQGKVSKELLNRLMSILGHLIQLRTLKVPFYRKMKNTILCYYISSLSFSLPSEFYYCFNKMGVIASFEVAFCLHFQFDSSLYFSPHFSGCTGAFLAIIFFYFLFVLTSVELNLSMSSINIF